MTKKRNDKNLWTEPSCASCMLNIAYLTLQKSTDDRKIQFESLKKLYKLLDDFSETVFPTEISTRIYRMLQDTTKNKDPFKKEKERSNILGIEVSNLIKGDIDETRSIPKRIYKAIIATIVGNIIDFGTDKHQFRLDTQEFMKLYYKNLETGFKIDDSKEFLALLNEIKTILYVADNAGEIAFDKLFIRELLGIGKKVVVAIKGDPVANDATMDDARKVGLQELDIELISTGSNALGVMIEEISEEFKEKLEKSELIIAKGQANWETFTYYKDFFKVPIFLILRVKCLPIAKFLGVDVGDNAIQLLK